LAPSAVLVMTLSSGDAWPIRSLLEELRDDSSISLVERDGVSLAQGMELVDASPALAVVLLIGTESELRRAVDLLRKKRPNIHILAVAMESGTATLSIRDTLADEIAAVVRSLTERDSKRGGAGGGEPAETGQVLRFSARAGPARPPANLPTMIAEGHADSGLLATLATAVAWAEAATRGFVEIWAAKGEEALGFTLSRDSLEEWLLRLVGLIDAPIEVSDRRFREFMRMLDHPSVAHTPIVQLANLLERDPLSLKLFLIVLAPELDIRFHRLFGSLHDDMSRRQPSAALACAIIAAATAKATPADIRAQIACLCRLRRLRLIEGVGATIGSAEEPLRINFHVLDWLLSGDPDRLLAAPDVAALTAIVPVEAAALISADRQSRLHLAMARALAGHGDRSDLAAIVLSGSEPGWLEAESAILAERQIRIRTPGIAPSADRLDDALRSIVLAARLTDRHVVFERGSGADSDALWLAFDPLLPELADPAFIIAQDAAELIATVSDRRIAVVALPPPEFADRAAAVAAAIGAAGEAGERLSETIADRFRLPLDRFGDAVALGRSAAAAAGRAEPDPSDWVAGFRAAAGAGIPSLANLVQPRPCPTAKRYSCLDRVVLPPAQRELLESLIEHVRLGRTVLEEWGFGELPGARGVAALFSGPSGTGKTLAAHSLASELASDLYVVDLARILSKYIGESEERLDRLFDAAARAGAVLLFDEADALFGRRSEVKQALDRYANIEVTYLLQKMETFSGLAILTTNHPENIDPAFTRRLRFKIDFAKPDAAARLRIWELSIPRGAHRDERLDFDFYARRFEFTGGSIRQIALHAAVGAARAGSRIGRSELEEAIRTELLRLGNYADLAQLEPRAA